MPATVDGVSQQPAGTVRVEPGPNSAVRTLALIGSPVALVTALLLYFGWARSQAQAESALAWNIPCSNAAGGNSPPDRSTTL